MRKQMSKKSLKNKTAYGGKMLKMDDNVYALRRKVMDVLYDIKSRGYNIPRIEVRIVDGNTDACAYAYLGQNIAHFNKKYVGYKNLTQIVLHEVVHATFGVGEVIGCKLMHCSKFWENKVSESESWKLFDMYYQEFCPDSSFRSRLDELEKEFQEWMDENVYENVDGSFSTQDAQWGNRIETKIDLKKYFLREFRSEDEISDREKNYNPNEKYIRG
tara:strand:+ start:8904 stop:9551 length:648 start_codon:yes stop_codon:yes gene_type:complete